MRFWPNNSSRDSLDTKSISVEKPQQQKRTEAEARQFAMKAISKIVLPETDDPAVAPIMREINQAWQEAFNPTPEQQMIIMLQRALRCLLEEFNQVSEQDQKIIQGKDAELEKLRNRVKELEPEMASSGPT